MARDSGSKRRILAAHSAHPDGQPNPEYAQASKPRFAQWIIDMCTRERDQAWLDYQYLIGARHMSAAKNAADGADSTPFVPLRYVLAFIAPTVEVGHLLAEGFEGEELSAVRDAWTRAVTVAVTVWAYAYRDHPSSSDPALATYDSPIGRLTLAARGGALVGLWAAGQRFFDRPYGIDGASAHPAVDLTSPDSREGALARTRWDEADARALRAAASWLDGYFAGEASSPPPFLSRPRAPTFNSACGRRWTPSPTARRARTGTSRPRCGTQACPHRLRRSAGRSDAILYSSSVPATVLWRRTARAATRREGRESLAACARGRE